MWLKVTTRCRLAMNLFILLSCFGSSTSFGRSIINISTMGHSALYDICEEILQEAYDRLDIIMMVKTYPGNRSLELSNMGKIDGELFRAKLIQKKYKNLIIIPVELVKITTVAFSKKSNIRISGWKSLLPYKISYVRGFKLVEENTLGMKRFEVKKTELAFKMLMANRVDLVIETAMEGKNLVSVNKYKGIQILKNPLAETSLYHFLHKKHKELIPKITAVLLDMEKKGRIKKIRNK